MAYPGTFHIFRRLTLVVFCCFAAVSLFSQPGKNGNYTVTTTNAVVNKYCPVTSSIGVGSSTLVLANFSMTALCPGDLIMVYQAQGATLNYTSTSSYGDINSYNSSGLYEFKYIQSVNGNTITTQTTFTNSYATSGYIQVVKVPQYNILTVNSLASIAAKAWKDTVISSTLYRFGGLVVIHATQIVNNGTITASGLGFRGGAVFYNTSIYFGSTAYTSTNSTLGGEKGEGIGGFYAEYDLNGGRYCMGAPANGGGGGNNHNSGGGGGGNGYNLNTWTGQGVMVVNTNNPLTAWSLSAGYVANGNAITNSSGGGHGGYTHGNTNANATVDPPGSINWTGDLRREMGGIGGRPLTNIDAEKRIYFGGGGGAADANNNASASGSNGGGIVYLIASSGISGTGLISANGIDANNTSGCSCDAAPGAGAGGSIVLKVGSISTGQTVSARGGNGGSQLTLSAPGSQSNESEGPGGGGGGGFVAIASGGVTPNINGGLNGTSASGAVTEMTSNGATSGATGQTSTVSTTFISFSSVNSLTLSSNSPVCSPATLSLSVSSTGSVSYLWSGPSFTSALQNPTLSNASASMSGVYSVTITGSGCTSSGSIAVSVYQHSLSVAYSSLTCHGLSNGSATAAITGGTGNYSYSWTGTTATGSVVNGLTAGNYTVNILDVGASCTRSQSFQVVQPPTHSLGISAAQTSACTSSSIHLSSSTSGGTPPYTYSWTNGPATASYNVSETTAGLYTYTLSSADAQNCIKTATFSLNFAPLPQLQVSNYTICPGASPVLTVSGADSYTWYPVNTTGNAATVSPMNSTTYTVDGLTLFGCFGSKTLDVFVKPGINLAFATSTITCASLGSATVTASGTSGPFNYTWVPVSQTGSAVSGLYPGSYTVHVFDSSTGCVFSPTTHFSPLVPLTGTVISTSSIMCHGANTATAEINLAGGSGNQSYLWLNNNSAQTSSLATGLGAGITTVTVIDALTYCSVTETLSLTQPSDFTLTISASVPSVCIGGSIPLTAANSGGTPNYTYTWQSTVNDSAFIANESSPGIYSYSVVSTDANGCTAQKTASLEFVPNPTVTVVSSVSVCLLETATLQASGASTYTWNSGTTGANFTVVSTAPAVYTVTGSSLSCTASATGSIFVKPVPTVTFTGVDELCEGSTLSLINASQNGNYFWWGPQNFTATSQHVNIASSYPNMTGFYYLKVVAPNSCTASLSKYITIHPKPPLTIAGSTVCEGQLLNLSANFIQNGTYLWSGPSFSSTVQSPVIPAASLSSSGAYSLLVSSTHGCTNMAVAHCSVVAIPNPTITGDENICLGDTLFLSATGGSSFSWYGPLGFNSSSHSIVLANVSTLNSGTYSLIAYQGACSGITTKTIAIHTLPNPVITTNSPLCEKSSLSLVATGAVNYTWTTPNGGVLIGPSHNLPSVTYSDNGFYSLSGEDSFGCSNMSSVFVSILPSPTLVANAPPFCDGGTASISATANGTYLWQGPGGFSSNAAILFFPSANAQQAGFYTLTVTGVNSCMSSTVVQLNISNLPLPTPTLMSGPIACENAPKLLVATGGDHYHWQGPNNFSAVGSTVSIPASLLSSTGSYSLVVTHNNNCSVSRTIALNIVRTPTAQLITEGANRCAPFNARIKLETTDPITESNIFIGNQLFKTTNLKYYFLSAGQYPVYCSYTDTNGCVGSSTLLVNAYPKPVANFSFNKYTNFSEDEEIHFVNLSDDDGETRWAWFLSGSHLDTVHTKEPYYSYPTSGNYPVVLVIANKWGCLDTAMQTLRIEKNFSIYVPNAFSPNDDGLNDLFFPKGEGIKIYGLEIYDRWGEKIFQSNSMSVGWDGTFRGQPCKSDTYTWLISIVTSDGAHKKLNGHLSLLRGDRIAE